MKKIPAWIIIVVIIVLLIVSKFLFFSKPDTSKGAGASKAQGAQPIAVNYFVADTIAFNNNVFATGKVGAMNEVNLAPETGGKVVAIYFKEGETVQKGSLLVKLNDADLQAQLQKVRLQVKLAQNKLERVRKLMEVNGVSKEEFEMQENEVSALKADESVLLAQIGKTSIVAPFTGVIGLKNISEGSFVTSLSPVVTLVQVKPIFIEFSVPGKYSELFKNSAIKFSTEGVQTSKTFSASIYAIEPKVDEATKTIRARALYNGEETIYPGTFVKVFVDLGSTMNTIMIPTQCVIPTLKGQKVMVSRNSVAQEAPVKIGVRTDEYIQILEGLNVGDTIIATGILSVKKDSKLKLIKPVK